MDIQFFKYSSDVGSDRVEIQIEAFGNFLVKQSLRQEFQAFQFTGGEFAKIFHYILRPEQFPAWDTSEYVAGYR
ncbi:hypothetical protein GCM10023212_11680 [Luteolibacter yonseiensis]